MGRHRDHPRSILFGLDFLVWLEYANTNMILPIKAKNNIWKRSGQWQLWFCSCVLHEGSGSRLRMLSLGKRLCLYHVLIMSLQIEADFAGHGACLFVLILGSNPGSYA